MEKIKAVFFDFDGVLIDSLPSMKIAWKAVKKSFHISADFKDFQNFIGIPFISILKELNIDERDFISIKKKYSEIASKNKKLIKLNPYVNELITWLRGKKIKVAIVTSKDYARTVELLEYFDLQVDAVVTPELTSRGKPHPDPLFKATELLSIDIKEAIFIGDMISDMRAASKAKCLYLHYTSGYQKINATQYGGSIDSLLEIKEFISFYK